MGIFCPGGRSVPASDPAAPAGCTVIDLTTSAYFEVANPASTWEISGVNDWKVTA